MNSNHYLIFRDDRRGSNTRVPKLLERRSGAIMAGEAGFANASLTAISNDKSRSVYLSAANQLVATTVFASNRRVLGSLVGAPAELLSYSDSCLLFSNCITISKTGRIGRMNWCATDPSPDGFRPRMTTSSPSAGAGAGVVDGVVARTETLPNAHSEPCLVSDHPVSAASEASRHFLSGGATPPLGGGEYYPAQKL